MADLQPVLLETKQGHDVGQFVAAKKQEHVDRSWWQVNAVWSRIPNHQLGRPVQPTGCPLRLENGDALLKKIGKRR